MQNIQANTDYIKMAKNKDNDMVDQNWVKEESYVTDFIKREEGMVSGIRNILTNQDEASKKIT